MPTNRPPISRSGDYAAVKKRVRDLERVGKIQNYLLNQVLLGHPVEPSEVGIAVTTWEGLFRRTGDDCGE